MYLFKTIKIFNRFKTVLILAVFIAFSFSGGVKINAGTPSFIVSSPNIYSELIESASFDYTINLGGTVDMDNTTTRGYPTYEVAFQPNISLEIENVGSVPIIDPWIVINDVRDWRNIDSIVKEATRGAVDEQDRLMLIYEFVRSNRYHNYPLMGGNELNDPVKHFNSYGAGFCGNIGKVTSAVAYHAGFTKERHGRDPVSRGMNGHSMSEIALNGRYQFIDTDENAFYLDPENERPVSGDDIVRDSDLAARDYTFGPLFSSWKTGEGASALLGCDDSQHRSITTGYEMHLTLRPGEKLTHRWDNIGKIPGFKAVEYRYNAPGKYYGNSFLDYIPELNNDCLNYAHKHSDVRAAGGNLIGTASNAFIVFEIKSPYPICGGAISAQFNCDEKTDNVGVAVSVDGENWSDVWQRTGRGSFVFDVSLDESLGVKKNVPVYSYFVRFSIASKNESARLSFMKLHSDLFTFPVSLPRLCLGKNSVRYTDKTEGPKHVKVTHTYQESWNIEPPGSPELVYPADNAVTKDDWIEFKWDDVPGADKYHLRVSRRPDMRTPYRPCYDVVINNTKLCNPRTGLFNPDETYYWSVRVRNREGVWGKWSPTQTFKWSGPRPPVELETVERNGKIYLKWQPNPRGNRPLSYEVYASNMKGFKPGKTPYEVISLGEVPSNFAAETTEKELLIVSPDPADNAPNKSFYRIIAIDKNRTPGGSSWPLELEHPFVYSKPLPGAKVGQLYEYRVLTLQSMGDLQHRPQKPGSAFWEKEGYEFSITEGPAWLTINPKTGLISGIPSKYDPGKTNITITVNRTWPNEVTTTYISEVSTNAAKGFQKNGPEFQASDEQRFTLNVIR